MHFASTAEFRYARTRLPPVSKRERGKTEPAPSRGTARVWSGRRESTRARAMRRGERERENFRGERGARAAGRRPLVGKKPKEKNRKTHQLKNDLKKIKKQGYFNEVALSFMEKVLEASGLAEKVRSERERERGAERGQGEERRERPLTLLQPARGREQKLFFFFFFFNPPLSPPFFFPKNSYKNPKLLKKNPNRRRSTKTSSGCRTSATPPPTATSSGRPRRSSRTSSATCSKRQTRGPTRSTP